MYKLKRWANSVSKTRVVRTSCIGNCSWNFGIRPTDFLLNTVRNTESGYRV